MASRKGRREERRRRELARLEAERDEQHRKRRVQIVVVGGSMLLAFALVLGATLIAGDGSSSSSQGAGAGAASAGSVPSSVGRLGGSTGVDVGEPFPDFRLTEAGGETLTPGSLAEEPAIVWFTTSYCVPCQVGARDVAELDDELGGEAFNVLVVFVDPSEPTSALTAWRDEFANDDWMVALDEENALAREVRLQALDSKFLLDPRGVIGDVDFEIVDGEYLERLRAAAT